MHTGKTLINHIDSEERQKIQKQREFAIPNLRTGDVVEVSMFNSISEAKVNTYKGLLYGRSKPNNLRYSLWFHSVADNVNFSYKLKAWSPMIARIQILKYGSNQNRKKLSHIPSLELSGTRLLEPIIHGRGYKPRSAVGRKSRGRARSTTPDAEVKEITFDDLEDQARRKKKAILDSTDVYER